METPLLSSSSPLETKLDIHCDRLKKYDVFLNFRGEDSAKNIMRNLRAALSQKGLKIFADHNDQTPRGQSISTQFAEAIEDSSCSVVILSQSYASSSRCLDELVKILDCAKNRGQILIPVFCHADASLLRKQVRSFAEAFAEHDEKPLDDSSERVHGWKVAVTEVTGLPALDLRNYRDEAHFVKEIAAEVSLKLVNPPSSKNLYYGRYRTGKVVIPGRYSVKSLVGSIGAALLFFIVAFPLLA